MFSLSLHYMSLPRVLKLFWQPSPPPILQISSSKLHRCVPLVLLHALCDFYLVLSNGCCALSLFCSLLPVLIAEREPVFEFGCPPSCWLIEFGGGCSDLANPDILCSSAVSIFFQFIIFYCVPIAAARPCPRVLGCSAVVGRLRDRIVHAHSTQHFRPILLFFESFVSCICFRSADFPSFVSSRRLDILIFKFHIHIHARRSR